jgi:membrane protein DedA with SNARE-associated domain/membrane-associated phospholipid phosphatase
MPTNKLQGKPSNMDFNDTIQNFTAFLSLHPNWGYASALLFAFLESLAVIGSIIPGAITMTIIGTMIGSGLLMFWPSLILCITGALIGDYLSYYLGITYQDRLISIWPISKFPHWLDKGREFFTKYGVGAIIIGRFFGPVRSMIPLIAGMLKMTFKKFVTGIIPSAVLWSLLYLTPGIVLGALSTNFPRDVAIEIIIDGILIIIAFWAMIASINAAQNTIAYRLDAISSYLWRTMAKLPLLARLRTTLHDPLNPHHHHQIYNLLLSTVSLSIFIIMAISSHHQGIITHFDQSVYLFFQSIRTSISDNLFVTLGVFAHHTTLLIATGLIACFALWHRRFWLAFCFITLAGVTSVTIYLTKLYVGHLRPALSLTFKHSFSFPSGHVALLTALLLFICTLIRDNKRLQQWTRIVSWQLIILVGLSRLCLGVHWLSDILGGLLLGIAISKFITFVHQIKYRPTLNPKKLVQRSSFALIAALAVMMPLQYQHIKYNTRPTVTYTTHSQSDWWQKNFQPSHYRMSRFGTPNAPLNLQINGTLKAIQASLEDDGWEAYPAAEGISSIIIRSDNPEYHLPLVNPLHLNQRASLIMIKPATPPIALRLWATPYLLQSQKDQKPTPLWVGTVNQIRPAHDRFMPHLRYKPWNDFTDALNTLDDDMPGFNKKIIQATKSDLSKRLHWNRNIMLIDLPQ